MFAAFLSVALMAQAALPAGTPSRATPAAVLARVAACGLDRRHARIRRDDTLQQAVVDMGNATALSEVRLRCLARASAETSWLLVFDAATQARFEPLYFRVNEAAATERAQAWLAAHALSWQAPRDRDGNVDAAAIVPAIEKLCRMPAGSFPDIGEGRQVTGRSPLSAEQRTCALNVAQGTGLRFGFAGNEAEAPSAPR